MKKYYFFYMSLIVFCFVSTFTHLVYSQEELFIPTTHEQFMLELINRDRSDPDAAAIRYGVSDLNDNVPPEFFISNTPKQPLAFNFLLQGAAAFHSIWQLVNDTFSHTGVGGFVANLRLTLFGYGSPGAFGFAENIGWVGEFPTTPDMEQSVLDLQRGYFRDDGQPSAGHRRNILLDEMKEAGIGTKPGQFFSSGTNWNAVMSTQDFAFKFDDPFITGVVYDDLDGDNFFTPFEELFPVVVAAVSQTTGDIFLTTAPFSPLNIPSGGYAIQVPPDTYAVLAFAGVLIDPVIQINVVVNTENVKVDLIPIASASISPETLNKSQEKALDEENAEELPSEVIIKFSEDPPTFLPE